VRELAALARWPWNPVRLTFYSEDSVGPVQQDEALLLHALVRALRPATIVEIGFLCGHSAFNFLRALDADARLYSFDIDPTCAEFARCRCAHDPRFVFRNRSQETLSAEDLDGRSVDFVFLDGAHRLDLHQATFARLLPLLSPNAVIAVHDTGAFPRTLGSEEDWRLTPSERWTTQNEFEHQPDERAFANWLLETHPEFCQLHLHSQRTFRHGITLVQRSAPLPRPAVDEHASVPTHAIVPVNADDPASASDAHNEDDPANLAES
jgi:predicted O-methyltransferase YrrM